MKVDVLAVGAHPDDVELGIGGTIHKLTSGGARVAILDLTRGELSSRGTPDERAAEARAAAEPLGVTERRNTGLPDGALANTVEQRQAVVAVIRELRPDVLLTHMTPDRHPDHRVAHALTRDANFFAGVARAEGGGGAHRADHVFYYHPYYQPRDTPDFVVDISDHLDAKMAALKAYRSQLHNPDYDGPATYVASEAFWTAIRVRAEYWGGRIGVHYGEPFFADGPIGLSTLPGLVRSP